MPLISDLQESDSSGLFFSNDDLVTYPTGILPLDYSNGFWMTSKDPNGNLLRLPMLGIVGGTFVSIIGSTGSGKSTIADQIGYAIIKDHPDGLLIHVDAERTNMKDRMIQVTGAEPNDPRILLRRRNITMEDVLDTIDSICKTKYNGKKKYMYEVPHRYNSNKSFWAYAPTVFVIDSLPAFNAKTFEVENMGTNMDAARGAKDISRFYCNCLERMDEFNITIITINHIKPKVETNQYASAPPGLMMLKPNEMVPRGYSAQFYSATYFRVGMVKSGMYDPDVVGFSGSKATLSLAKSKSNWVGGTIDIAFNKDLGFDPIYSLFQYADSGKLLVGRNPNLALQGLEDFKFSRRNFREVFLQNPEFREGFLSILTTQLEPLLGMKELTEDDRVRFGDYEKSENARMMKMEEEAEIELVADARKKKK